MGRRYREERGGEGAEKGRVRGWGWSRGREVGFRGLGLVKLSCNCGDVSQ